LLDNQEWTLGIDCNIVVNIFDLVEQKYSQEIEQNIIKFHAMMAYTSKLLLYKVVNQSQHIKKVGNHQLNPG